VKTNSLRGEPTSAFKPSSGAGLNEAAVKAGKKTASVAVG